LDTSLTEFIKIYSLYIFNTIKEEDEGEVTLLKKDRDNLTSDNGFLSREDGGINWKTLLLLLDKLRDLEPEYLLSIGKGQKRDVRPEKDMPSNSKALDKGITIHKKKYTLDITVFRNWWYTLVLGPKTKIMRQFLRDHDISFATQEDVEQMCDSYMKGLQWVLLYYVRGTLSVNRFWSYPYTQSPTMFDIYKVCRVMVKKKKTIHITPLLDKESDPFFGPLHQLLAVLPPKSSNLIDKKYSDLITGVRPLSYLAPVYFRIDYENARVDHEGLAILPIVDPFQIIEEVKKATPPRLIKRYLLGENFDTIILSQNHEDGIEYSEKEIKTLRWENRQEAIRLFGADFKDKKDSSHKKPYVKRDKEVKPYNKNYKGNNYNSNYKGKGKNKDTKISMRVEL
jgi:hypothetical protein